MLDFQRKKNFRKKLYSPLVLIPLVIVMALLISGVWGVYKKSRLSALNLEREKSELAKLEVRQKNLSKSIDYLKTEQGVEDEIRTKFRAVKEGEKIAVIIDDDGGTSVTANTSSTTESVFMKVFQWFR
jgi:cell division protein FtsB